VACTVLIEAASRDTGRASKHFVLTKEGGFLSEVLRYTLLDEPFHLASVWNIASFVADSHEEYTEHCSVILLLIVCTVLRTTVVHALDDDDDCAVR